MTTYGQFCPLAKATEVVAERWTPLVLRELLSGAHRFAEIQRGVPRMSPSLLSRRLKQLQRAGLVLRRDDEHGPTYHLTPAGEELGPVLEQLAVWGRRWIFEIADDELDVTLLMVNLQRRIAAEALPARRTVVHFRFTDAEPAERDWWILLGPGGADLCHVDEGFAVDLRIETDVRTMTEVWMGNRGLNEALRAGLLRLAGPRELKDGLHSWFCLHQFAHVAPAEPGAVGAAPPAPAGRG